jgi:septum site-determining protein MinC
MPGTSGARPPLSFDIKSTLLSLVALQLKSTDLSRLSSDFALRFGEMPDFFDDDGIVIDLSFLPVQPTSESASGLDTPLEFSTLIAFLRSYRLRPLAVRGGNARQVAAAMAAGLSHEPGNAPRAIPPRGEEPVRRAPAPVPRPQVGALVIEKPLRCGQQVYARGRDLVVMAMVNAGAEVIADGHIHIYAPLRGRATAGAQGNSDARIFALVMAAENVGIAGVYDTGNHSVCESVYGKAAQISLVSDRDGDRLIVDKIHA